MTQGIQISIIVPTYKPDIYLWKCIDSIYRQTIGLENFELILVLNGCKEPYLTAIKDYLLNKEGLDVKLLQTDKPGVSNARNIGLKEARGTYICFIDDDDWISNNYLKGLVDVSDRGADIVASNVTCYSEETLELSKDYIGNAFQRMENSTKIPIVKARKFMSSSCCKIIRRDKIGHTRFNCDFAMGEDSLFMASISNRTKNICTSAPDIIYYRRVRQQSASHRTQSLSTRVNNAIHLATAYTRILMSDCMHYNWIFFASRYAALLICIFRKR